jgi:hypothetical protein
MGHWLSPPSSSPSGLVRRAWRSRFSLRASWPPRGPPQPPPSGIPGTAAVPPRALPAAGRLGAALAFLAFAQRLFVAAMIRARAPPGSGGVSSWHPSPALAPSPPGPSAQPPTASSARRPRAGARRCAAASRAAAWHGLFLCGVKRGSDPVGRPRAENGRRELTIASPFASRNAKLALPVFLTLAIAAVPLFRGGGRRTRPRRLRHRRTAAFLPHAFPAAGRLAAAFPRPTAFRSATAGVEFSAAPVWAARSKPRSATRRLRSRLGLPQRRPPPLRRRDEPRAPG